ncbi:ATP synthase subunit I [Jeongeupia sp. USM3]|uniref:ATP synthase subunit I n=1 Tax=Jeongeupia sp. USM3 TaxID=1906741 RepID=UPI00089E08C9|nr:ATP synthase subunit I [Jeongeupia sp. USM3]AOY00881.1 hypothetical protein BJP62_10780 [Jeongeupia sp. USM3]
MVAQAQIKGVIRLKLGITLVVMLLSYLLWGRSAGIASGLGGAIALAGSMLYARIAYQMTYGPPAALMRLHFAAEAAKMAWTIIAFAAVFVFYRQVAWMWLFIGYIAATSAYWFGLLIQFNGKK